MQKLITGLLEFPGGRSDGSIIIDVKLDADLRDGPLRRPPVSSRARLRGLGERPDPKRFAARDLLAVLVAAVLTLQRQAEGLDIQPAAASWVGRDHRHRRNELKLHVPCIRSV
jgi:hypothetical protein